MNKTFAEELIELLDKHRTAKYTYINPHILQGCIDGLEFAGKEIPYEISRWVSNMWSC